MITLYGQPLSSYTAKVRVALLWRGLTFQECEPPGGYQSAAWREKVPMGTLPALEHDGFFLAESEAILEYLEDAFADRPLMPAQAQARARVRSLARLHDLHVEPRVRALFPLIRQPQQRARLPELLAALDDKMQRLSEAAHPQPYMAGTLPSLADCGFAVTLPLAHRLLEELGQAWRLPTALNPWAEAMAQDAAVQAALSPWRQATEAWLKAARSHR
jgi:glutathione S-transferase